MNSVENPGGSNGEFHSQYADLSQEPVVENVAEQRPQYPELSEDLIAQKYARERIKMIEIRQAQHNWQIEQALAGVEAARQEGLNPQEADARELDVLRELRKSVYEHGMRVPLNELHRMSQGAGEPPVVVSRPEAPYTNLHFPLR
jgi:hypothetical protein